MACTRSGRASAPPGGGTSLPLSLLPPGTRLRVLHEGFPVEVRRAAGGAVDALSLLCTHSACEVRWQAAEERYLCPCHHGLFAPDGRVLAGPPPAPLRAVAVRVEGDQVVVG